MGRYQRGPYGKHFGLYWSSKKKAKELLMEVLMLTVLRKYYKLFNIIRLPKSVTTIPLSSRGKKKAAAMRRAATKPG